MCMYSNVYTMQHTYDQQGHHPEGQLIDVGATLKVTGRSRMNHLIQVSRVTLNECALHKKTRKKS